MNNILMVGNFSSSTGYAWKMIGSCFNALGRHFIENGRRAIVCYPKVDIIPDYYKNSKIEVIELDFENAPILDLLYFIRKNRIKVIYLIDKATYSLKYAALRLSGVKKIVVHDRTSGDRTQPQGIKRIIKMCVNRFPLITADKVLVISEYVRSRQLEISHVPSDKVVTILNGVMVSDFVYDKSIDIKGFYNIPSNKKIIFCSGRANHYKGIHVFIQAADALINQRMHDDLFFVYCGDGPDLKMFKQHIEALNLKKHFLFTGHVDTINHILPIADICVAPSIWQEGFGRVVIEAMAAKVPVIASRVGGMAEILEDGVDGFYVLPGDYTEIADLVERLINDQRLYERIKNEAYKKVVMNYDFKNERDSIIKVFDDICGIKQSNYHT